jgi:hypothetical protein
MYKACTPIATFSSPVEDLGCPSKALDPIAIFKLPVVLLQSAPEPKAVLLDPEVLKYDELEPTDVLLFPVVFLLLVNAPIAVLFEVS